MPISQYLTLMEGKISAVAGIESDRYHMPGNDMNQASKIPWRSFIMPLKLDEGCDSVSIIHAFYMHTVIILLPASTVCMSLAFLRKWVQLMVHYSYSTIGRRKSHQWRSTIALCLSIMMLVLAIAQSVAGVIGWAQMIPLTNPYPRIWIGAVAMYLCILFSMSIYDLVYMWKAWRILHRAPDSD